MARKNKMQDRTTNPAKYFFEWSSKNQQFRHYVKDTKEYISAKLPFRFLALSEYVTVSGWNQKHKFSIVANEVKRGGKLVVKAFHKGGNGTEILAQGDWPSMKDVMELKKGKWTQSIYVMFPNGELGNLRLSGGSLKSWFDFQKNQTDRFMNDWVVVNSFKREKNGDVEYDYPVFEWGRSLSPDSQKMADAADALLEPYELSLVDPSHPEEQTETDQTPNRSRSEVDKYENDHQQKVDAELEMHLDISQEPEQDDDVPF